MALFRVYEVQEITTLRKWMYYVEANSKDEAIEQVEEGMCDPIDCGEFGDCDYGDAGYFAIGDQDDGNDPDQQNYWDRAFEVFNSRFTQPTDPAKADPAY